MVEMVVQGAVVVTILEPDPAAPEILPLLHLVREIPVGLEYKPEAVEEVAGQEHLVLLHRVKLVVMEELELT